MNDRRLLVVDDDPTTRFALSTLFARQGWTVSQASTVGEAMADLNGSPAPRCVILDLNLPDGRGESVLRAVREAGLKTVVAVCSGVDDAARISDVLSLRPEVLLAKPVDPGPFFHFCQASMVH